MQHENNQNITFLGKKSVTENEFNEVASLEKKWYVIMIQELPN